ncbi:MAG: hypothetical protein JST22_07765 [Bacteroidetes bacterium]|nr:hypothetical protein [Bacteroidota bacterium]
MSRRWTFITIGAGTIVLALIVFSGICWGTFTICGGWLRRWGFWEILVGMMLLGGLAIFLVPTMLRRRAERFMRVSNLAPPECNVAGNDWRDLYNQLSEAERQEFKALMAKYCGCEGEKKIEDASDDAEAATTVS